MAKKGHSEEEILRALRKAESGATVVEICEACNWPHRMRTVWIRAPVAESESAAASNLGP